MLKKEYKNITILFIILTLMILIPTGFNMFGSDTDWINQHTVFPEYLRQLFYDTKTLIPNFSLNYGAGQNIFNIAYYGLLNPIILLSYLFPFIKMTHYIMGISIIILYISTFLFYKWLRNNKYSQKVALITSIIFITSGPLVFQMHRHIMFVNYMPFLLLGLIAVDSYINKNKKILLIISSFLMIMTSFYYSVGGILVLIIYFIFKKIKVRKKLDIKQFLKDLLIFILYIFVSILMSSVLILPVFYTILQTRNTGTYNIFKLLIINVNPTKILYGAYSTGLTCIAFISVLWFAYVKKKNFKFLGISLLILFFVPIFTCLLNGGLYFRAKVFIPFIPLICLIIGTFIKNLTENKINIEKLIIFLLFANIIVLASRTDSIIYYLDFFTFLLILIIYNKFRKELIVYIPVVLLSIFSGFYMNFTEDYISYKKYDEIFNIDESLLDNYDTNYRVNNLVNSNYTVNKIYNSKYYTTNIYSSTYNNNYYNFVRNEFKQANPYYNSFMLGSTNNILFDTYMGNKYIISKSNPGNKYNLINEKNGIGLYENNNAFSIGFVNNNLMSEEEYNKLTYPYNIEALLNYVIVNKDVEQEYKSKIEKVDLKYSYTKEGLKLRKSNTRFTVNVEEKGKINIYLRTPLKNKILLIDFNGTKPNSCTQKEVSITINGIKNSITCDKWIYPNQNETFHYVISEENLESLTVEFSKGNFMIENLNVYVLDYNEIIKNYDKLNITKIKNNTIEGNINVTNDGYFNLTIPYDKGFTIYVDGTKTNYELVNKSFIGFPISKGSHDIKIVYTSPLLKTGKILSIIGIIILFGIIGKEVENKKLLKLKKV